MALYKKRILILQHSSTGVSAKLGRMARGHLEAAGHKVRVEAIRPRRPLPYLLNLIISFIPGVSLPTLELAAKLEDFDALLLIFPKWTFAHPLINDFIKNQSRRLPPTALIVTCGGWDEDRYLEGYLRKLREARVPLLGGETFRRKSVDRGLATMILRLKLRRWFS
ncbi:MAG: hypothetical protein C0609_04575 [Deltaproteobacteria bacterium]|nr:MAG: hypothetical protein C0609_04575 [Deltaproteobacteria bacterium]